MAGASAVIVDDGQPPPKLLEGTAEVWVPPFCAQIAEWHPWDEDQHRPSASYGESQAYAIGAARVADPRHGLHDPTLARPDAKVPIHSPPRMSPGAAAGS